MTVVVPSDSDLGGLTATSSTTSPLDAKRLVWTPLPGPPTLSRKSVLQTASIDPFKVHDIFVVTTWPSTNVWTDRVVVANVRQTVGPLVPGPVGPETLVLLGLVGDDPPPLQAMAPAQTSIAVRAWQANRIFETDRSSRDMRPSL
jgi:hypothetical protein